MKINGKEYPLWNQFINNKDKWIGGTLIDSGDIMDNAWGVGNLSTKITDIILKPNGEESAYFAVEGEDFSCGFDVQVGGISGEQGDGWLKFSGYMGHSWKIKMKE